MGLQVQVRDEQHQFVGENNSQTGMGRIQSGFSTLVWKLLQCHKYLQVTLEDACGSGQHLVVSMTTELCSCSSCRMCKAKITDGVSKECYPKQVQKTWNARRKLC